MRKGENMREIFIKYNPYKLVTEIKIDGESLKKNSKLNFEDRRLQEWVEDLPDLLFEECSTRDFKIIFHGTIPDYEDMLNEWNYLLRLLKFAWRTKNCGIFERT